MKDTFKNSIIGAFAIFGLVALISSSNTAPTVIHEGTPESHVWQFHMNAGDGVANTIHYAINKKTGEVKKYHGGTTAHWYVIPNEK